MVLVTKRMLNPKRGGGVSTFVRGIAKSMPDDTLVEIHCVGPDNLDVYEIDHPNVVTYGYPQMVKIKAEEPGIFQRIMINFDQIEEFRHALNKSVFTEEKLYDAIVTTCPESALACISFGAMIEPFNVIYTTHHGLMSDSLSKVPFDDAVIYFANEVIPKSGFVTSVTQTPLNAEWLQEKHGVKVDHIIPLLPDELPPVVDMAGKEGALFIGKYETGKRPELFVEMCKQTGIKGKVMCGGIKAPDAWHKAFKEAGVTNYEIRQNLQGKEKEDFIASAKFTFVSSQNESYGYLALEGLFNGPTMIADSRWAKFWERYGATLFTKKSMAEVAKSLNDVTLWDNSDLVDMLAEAKAKWVDVICNRKNYNTKPNSSMLKYVTPEWQTLADLAKARDVRSLSSGDYKPLFDHCEIVHTDNESKVRRV
ncbi:glycosyltransferase [Xanthomonas phage BUDD]|nr:glycosyltransferase [Xanthomonas phage BUDD]